MGDLTIFSSQPTGLADSRARVRYGYLFVRCTPTTNVVDAQGMWSHYHIKDISLCAHAIDVGVLPPWIVVTLDPGQYTGVTHGLTQQGLMIPSCAYANDRFQQQTSWHMPYEFVGKRFTIGIYNAATGAALAYDQAFFTFLCELLPFTYE